MNAKHCAILVCDDSPSFAAMLEAILHNDGFADVQVLTDPRLVVPTLAQREFDLLLLDIIMPHIGGVEVTRRVRDVYSESRLPILVLTGSQDNEVRNQALTLGANDYLHKPIDPVEVPLRVHNLLAVRQNYKTQLAYGEMLESEVASRTLKLNRLIENALMFASVRDRNQLLTAILDGGTRLAPCDAATLYLITEGGTLRFALRTLQDNLPASDIPLRLEDGAPNTRHVSAWAANHQRSVAIADVYAESSFDLSGTREFDARSGYRTVSMLTVPLSPRSGEVIGVLQFINALDADGHIVPFSQKTQRFMEALAAQAAVALDNLQLVESQAGLIDGIIRVIASSIDAKSAHTGRHCERVPELAIMLAEAAGDSDRGVLADFRFDTAEQWREFRIGAWLHDCGKLTTPDYVVDKGAKLECFYNRIHEVRTRFEVLLRDARIAALQARLDGVEADAAEAAYAARASALHDDYAFLATHNLGSESVGADAIARLERIAASTWLRHFDNRIGLAMDEARRHGAQPDIALPAIERILSDQPWHIIPREAHDWPKAGEGFKVKVPDQLYHHGELYNMRVERGTLTEEERYKINEHIIQTIVMLEELPLPKTLSRVPEYAGTHHETLAGTGYPRQLAAAELSVPSRIMAVADIFEALTASDRPYKTGKPLSETLRILAALARRRHIDSDVFNLLLESGVLLRYAEQYLQPGQIDCRDFSGYLTHP